MNDGLKILLVDDDKIMLFLHQTFLKRSGVSYDTVLCYNGQEALDYLDMNEAMATTFLILLDINMPVMNGWEFLRAIRDRPYLSRVQIVMVSSATEETEKARAFAFGQVIDYQQKPLTIESCRRIISSDKLRGFFDDPLSQ
ncbi:response regulator [Dyadobacter beijingensis]|uniref:Response regulator n=1 Tax=Dyadobacter beijingensis TaxID=365489 RepID=A0ABQ2IAS2_9BACT|nr:response regulator [Dyadobacter beijingensis]GGN02379.1 response regulator [Dyadobacter beijingensis]